MAAKEMFENLNFICANYDIEEKEVFYRKEYIDDLGFKVVNIIDFYGDIYLIEGLKSLVNSNKIFPANVEITLELNKAIQKQIEELGWEE